MTALRHKLSQVDFGIPQAGGRDDFLKPWRMTSDDGRFSMDFTPVLDRASRASALVVESVQHQVFGRFTGTVVLDDGRIVRVQDLMGFAEKVKTGGSITGSANASRRNPLRKQKRAVPACLTPEDSYAIIL